MPNSGSAGTQQVSAVEVDGVTFTVADVQRKNPAALFQARNAMFDAERKALDDLVNDYLLEREARRLNITSQQLLETKVYKGLTDDLTDQALRVYYDGLDVKEPFEAIRDKIRDHIRERRMAKAKAAYVQSLRAQSKIAVRLVAPRMRIELADAPVRGAANAPVMVVEYADYECPYCQQIAPVLSRLQQEYKGRIAFAYKDVPLPMHANAQKAAEAAHCAGAQGKFWEYHDLLFASKQYELPKLKDFARSLKLDESAFNGCLDSGAQAPRVKSTLAEAQSLGLPGTPGFFVNGRFLSGAVDYQALRDVIEEELGAAGSSRAETAHMSQRQ